METLLAFILSFGAGFWDVAPPSKTSAKAEIIWLEGSVTMDNASKQRNNLRIGNEILAGNTLLLDEGESITLLASSHHLIVLNGPTVIEIEALLERDLSANYPRLDRVSMRVVPGRWPDLSITLAPSEPQAALSIQSPRATAVTVNRPWITWQRSNQIAGINLRLEVLRSNGIFAAIERWSNVRTKRFQFSRTLRRGLFYRIVAEHEGFKDAASFYVLDEDELTAVINAEKRFQATLDSLELKPTARGVLMARWLDDHSLADRATKKWIELEATHPTVSHFKRQAQRHRNRALATPDGLLSLQGTLEWLLELTPIFLPIR